MRIRDLSIACILLLTSITLVAQETVKGRASYYSDKLHGHVMSNGDKYNRDSMTCAHLKYPLGTMLKVRNPINDSTVIVKVTDRGPHTRRFIIDLSRAAARRLGIIASGFSQVEITPYHENQIPYKWTEELPEVPELDLEYNVAATYPNPAWQKDSVEQVKPATEPKVQRHEDKKPSSDTIRSAH